MKTEQDRGFARRFGSFIRSTRLSRGLLQEDLAAALDISPSYVSAFELGKRRIDFSMAIRLCAILEIDLNDFIQNYSDTASSS